MAEREEVRDLPARSGATLSELLDLTEEDSRDVVAMVGQTLVDMAADLDENGHPPPLSLLEIAKRSGVHPVAVAAVMKYSPDARELGSLLESLAINHIESTYVGYAMGRTDCMDLDEDGRFVPRLSKEQLHGMRFVLEHKRRVLEPEVDDLLKRALGVRQGEEPELEDGESRMAYLKKTMSGRKKK